jgi:hypothetical protein
MVAIQCKHSHTVGIPASLFFDGSGRQRFSPPLCFVEKPLTALLVADIGRRLRQVTTTGKKTEARPR